MLFAVVFTTMSNAKVYLAECAPDEMLSFFRFVQLRPLGDFKVGVSVGVYCTKCTLNTGVNTNFEIVTNNPAKTSVFAESSLHY
jgi:hypothetical protein